MLSTRRKILTVPHRVCHPSCKRKLIMPDMSHTPDTPPATPTKAIQDEAVVPPAPRKPVFKLSLTAASPTKPTDTSMLQNPIDVQSVIAAQKEQFKNLNGFVYCNVLYEVPSYCNLQYLFKLCFFQGNNISVFKDHTYEQNPFLVKGPISEDEFKKTEALEIHGLTLPMTYLRFAVDLPTGFATDAKAWTYYLGQPMLETDLFEIEYSYNPLGYEEKMDVICLLLEKLAAFHEIGYTHGDVSLENIVYTRLTKIPGGPLHYIDFECSEYMYGTRNFKLYGKRDYTDPYLKNSLEQKQLLPDWYYETYPDIFAVGMVIWNLVFGIRPSLSDLAEQGTKNYINNCKLPKVSDGLLDLLASLLDCVSGKSVQSSLDKFQQCLKNQ